MKVYKVVRVTEPNELETTYRVSASCDSSIVRDENRVRYSQYHRAYPQPGFENSWLYAFKTKEDARLFFDHMVAWGSHGTKFELWEADAKQVSRVKPVALNMGNLIVRMWNIVAKQKQNHKKINLDQLSKAFMKENYIKKSVWVRGLKLEKLMDSQKVS